MSDYIPTDLIFKILTKLPVESLIRFTIVCKGWHSLIKSPFFIASHLSNARNENPSLLFNSEKKAYCTLSLLKFKNNGSLRVDPSLDLQPPYGFNNLDTVIVGVCNGVICLFNRFGYPSVALWNPAVKTHVYLPMGFVTVSYPNNFIGFGVVNDDYMVVRLIYGNECDDSSSIQVEIFTLETGMWRKLSGADVKLQIDGVSDSPVFLNGVVHWLGEEGVFGEKGYRSSILAFRFTDEIFYELALPDGLAKEHVKDIRLPLVVESLGVIKYDSVGNCYDVWWMNNGESWSKAYRIQFRLVGTGFLMSVMYEVLGFQKNGEILLLVEQNCGHVMELVAYNPDTSQAKKLGIFARWYFSLIYNYVESLALLSRGSRVKHYYNYWVEI